MGLVGAGGVGKIIETQTLPKNIPEVTGTNDMKKIFQTIEIIKKSDFDIRKAPITDEKLEMMSNRTASEDKQDIAYVVVMDNKDALFMPQMLNEHFKFHHYDLASCLSANKKKMTIGVTPISVIHSSPGLTNYHDPEFQSSEALFLDNYA